MTTQHGEHTQNYQLCVLEKVNFPACESHPECLKYCLWERRKQESEEPAEASQQLKGGKQGGQVGEG